MPAPQHHRDVIESVPVALLTVSDTRTPRTDASGAAARELLIAAGHEIVAQEIVPDDPDRILAALAALPVSPACRAVILTGGTGIAPRDVTVETIAPLLEKRLDGFGELFRALSFDEIGPAAMLSRALAGVLAGRIVFVVPGSTAAVRLALNRLILPELPHLARLLDPGDTCTT